jgi:hypothetical protein
MSIDSKYLIRVGDMVHVNYNNAQISLGRGRELEVLYVPSQIGDNWILFDREGNEVHYVGEPCTIIKKLPARPGIDDKF